MIPDLGIYRAAKLLIDQYSEDTPIRAAEGADDSLQAGDFEGAPIRPMPNRVTIPAFSPFLYRYRNLVERFFNKIKQFGSQLVTTSSQPTISPSSSLHQSGFGCVLMSPRPS